MRCSARPMNFLSGFTFIWLGAHACSIFDPGEVNVTVGSTAMAYVVAP